MGLANQLEVERQHAGERRHHQRVQYQAAAVPVPADGDYAAGLLHRARQPFNVNAIAQAAVCAALDDDEFAARSARENRAGLAQLEAGCRALGLETVPSVANFLLVRVGDPSAGSAQAGARVFAALQKRGLIVRPLQPYALPEWIRVTVGTAAVRFTFSLSSNS